MIRHRGSDLKCDEYTRKEGGKRRAVINESLRRGTGGKQIGSQKRQCHRRKLSVKTKRRK